MDILPTFLRIVGVKVRRLLSNEALPFQQIPAEFPQNFGKLALGYRF